MAQAFPFFFSLFFLGCSTMRDVLALKRPPDRRPIHNPFSTEATLDRRDPKNWTIRSKRPGQETEIEIPEADKTISAIRLPSEFSTNAFENSSNKRSQNVRSTSDVEITSQFHATLLGQENRVNQLEDELGLRPSDDQLFQTGEKSYLLALDEIKSHFKEKRLEKALLATDRLLEHYPSDSRAHAMRGTLLDLLGEEKLAMKAWHQALRIDPKNTRLKRFLDRKGLEKRS